MRVRHVQRLHTAQEIEADTDRCLVCGAVARGTYDLDYAAGASTLDMTVPLPDVPLCGSCLVAQQRAMAEGNRGILVSLFAPPLLVLGATALAPIGTPVVLVAIAALSLLATRMFVGYVTRRRAIASRVLFLDGAGEDVLLQVRVEGGVEAEAGYREQARERPRSADEKSARPRGPKVKVGIGLVLSALVTALATLVGWFGAYPFVVFDNPTTEASTVTIDGVRRLSIPAGGKAVLTLGYGKHKVLLAAKETRSFDLELRFGGNVLLSQDDAACYHVVSRPVGKAAGWEQTVRGPRVAIDDPGDVTRMACPAPYRLR